MTDSLMGTFAVVPEFRRAVELWAEYYNTTEIFDRLHCRARSPRTGNAIPVTSDEYRACARNARDAMRALTERRNHEAIPDDVWQQAQRVALDMAEGRQ